MRPPQFQVPVTSLQWPLERTSALDRQARLIQPQRDCFVNCIASGNVHHRARVDQRWFVQHWQLKVMFREIRDHLGVGTQRQWSNKAIAHTVPYLLGLFSFTAL